MCSLFNEPFIKLVPQPHLPRFELRVKFSKWDWNCGCCTQKHWKIRKYIKIEMRSGLQCWNNVETMSEFPRLFWGWNEVVFECWNNVRIPTKKHCDITAETTSFHKSLTGPPNYIFSPRLSLFLSISHQLNWLNLMEYGLISEFEQWKCC